jgi:hypothetical protein
VAACFTKLVKSNPIYAQESCHFRCSALAFCDTALDTWIECISREERQGFWLPFEPSIIFVVVDQSLKAWVATDWFLTSSFDMINIVVMQEPEIWWGAWCPAFRFRNKLFFSSRDILWCH